MSDVVKFVRARLNEDENIARASIKSKFCQHWEDMPNGEWTFTDGEAEAEARSQREYGGRIKFVVHASVTGGNFHLDNGGSPHNNADFIHIARHDPARVLREVAAKRVIVETCEAWSHAAFPDFDGGYASAMEGAVMDIANIYSDHPGFRDEWRSR